MTITPEARTERTTWWSYGGVPSGGVPFVTVVASAGHTGTPRTALDDLARTLRQLVEAPTAAHRGPRRTR